MQKKTFSLILLFVIYVILFFDLMAFKYFFYWRFWWYDIVMHFTGGLWIALLGYYLFFFAGFAGLGRKIIKSDSVFWVTFVFVLTIGILWELFELIATSFDLPLNYFFDTGLDLIMDMLGWALIYYFFLRKIVIQTKSKIITEKLFPTEHKKIT
ncbi:MAG: hypothetical protein KAR54_01740 [Candidatus Pacebacteria bacterium]|nr:hypothetical protein [Candidatus Paceibacterota bacterium]